MNPCPVCATEIEESFGLIECPHCHNVLFVDFDGSLKLQNAEEPQDTESIAAAPSTVPSDEERDASWDASSVAMVEDDVAPEVHTKEKTQNKILSEIQTFADSEKSNLTQGLLFYDVTLYNVDTQELRDQVTEVLQEGKLNIDLKKINFKLPQLTIKDLNAVKASVLVTRLKHLPIDIEWTQVSILQDGGVKK